MPTPEELGLVPAGPSPKADNSKVAAASEGRHPSSVSLPAGERDLLEQLHQLGVSDLHLQHLAQGGYRVRLHLPGLVGSEVEAQAATAVQALQQALEQARLLRPQ
jgi:hypothetical protein